MRFYGFFLLLIIFSGCKEVKNDLSNKCELTESNQETYKWCSLEAKQGNAEAQYNLGVMYDTGQYVTQDSEQALKWFTLAAEQGFVKAQFILGLYYFFGLGETPDLKQAYKWFKLAAEQGDYWSQFKLGDMYKNGQWVTQNNLYAYMWYDIASSDGDKEALEYKDTVASQMTKEQITEAQKLARECVAKNYKGC